MSTLRRGVTRPAPQPREKPPVTYKWVTRPASSARPYGVLSIAVGDNEACIYFVQPFESDFGRAYELTKLDGIGGTVYHVCLNGKASTCDCPGFEQHRHCKHHDSLAKALAAGELPVPAVAAR